MSEKSSNAYLAQQGFSAGLAECVFKNQSQGDTIFPGPMASTVEAIIGAAFDDDEKTSAQRRYGGIERFLARVIFLSQVTCLCSSVESQVRSDCSS